MSARERALRLSAALALPVEVRPTAPGGRWQAFFVGDDVTGRADGWPEPEAAWERLRANLFVRAVRAVAGIHGLAATADAAQARRVAAREGVEAARRARDAAEAALGEADAAFAETVRQDVAAEVALRDALAAATPAQRAMWDALAGDAPPAGKLIHAQGLLGGGLPEAQATRLADHLIDRPDVEWGDLEVDLRCCEPGTIISHFFAAFLQRVAERAPDLLAPARSTRWHLSHEFQRVAVAGWMANFVPLVPVANPDPKRV